MPTLLENANAFGNVTALRLNRTFGTKLVFFYGKIYVIELNLNSSKDFEACDRTNYYKLHKQCAAIKKNQDYNINLK